MTSVIAHARERQQRDAGDDRSQRPVRILIGEEGDEQQRDAEHDVHVDRGAGRRLAAAQLR